MRLRDRLDYGWARSNRENLRRVPFDSVFQRAFQRYSALPDPMSTISQLLDLVSEWKYLALEFEFEHAPFCIVLSMKNDLYDISTVTRSDIILGPKVVLRLRKDLAVEGQGLIVGRSAGYHSTADDFLKSIHLRLVLEQVHETKSFWCGVAIFIS